ncbi:MAG: hypothetical protein JWN46_2877 [Acidimicrobiales bacterium]|nr:hypothetical protein [Acidimicrobiales bacterium]
MNDARVEVAAVVPLPEVAERHGLQGAAELTISDRYAADDPTGAALVRAKVAELRQLILERSPQRSDEDSEIVDRLYGPSPALQAWRKLVPSARALEPLYRPDGDLPDGTPIDSVGRRFFVHSLDSRAVRSRGAAAQWLLERLAADGADQRWASLACGAARPVCDAARAALDDGTDVEVTVLDWDPDALDMATEAAAEATVEHAVRCRLVNVLQPAAVHAVVAPGSCSVVECLGFFEYLPTVVPAGSQSGADFLRLAASLLRPGGTLVYANMLATHPELDFTMHAARWPLIVPRSIEEILQIGDAAGLDRTATSIWLPDSGVTAVVATKVG